MQYAVFKLMNGDEIIAKVIDQNKETIKLYHPVQIHRHMSPIGHEMIRCSYWMLFNKSPEVIIERQNIITFAEDVNNNVIKHYEFFLKHADHQELDHDMGDIVEAAEQEYKRRMKKYDEIEAKVDEIDLLTTPANTTIH